MPYKETKVEKIFFTIAEVSEELKVKQHTIRYWESVFQVGNPTRMPNAMRRYSSEEFEVLKKIKHLLKVEKLTIEGARVRMKLKSNPVPLNGELIKRLENIRKELESLLQKI